jgi:hypothetical protein
MDLPMKNDLDAEETEYAPSAVHFHTNRSGMTG